jgi:hypothetical protein
VALAMTQLTGHLIALNTIFIYSITNKAGKFTSKPNQFTKKVNQLMPRVIRFRQQVK